MSIFKKIALGLVFLAHLSLGHSQELELRLDKDTMLIGDHLLMTLSVTPSDGDRIFFPEFIDTSFVFDIIEEYPLDTVEGAISKQLLLTQFNAGRYMLGDIPALVQQPSGKVDTLHSNVVGLTVNTLEVDTTQAFKEIKAEKSLPFPWKAFLKKLLLILLPILLILLLIIWYLIKRKKLVLFQEKPKTMLDFYEEALTKLDDLDSKQLWQNDSIKEYYLGISEILRAYVEGRFGIHAMESTTDEIAENLILDKALKNKLTEILKQADLAKFAKFKPYGDENTRMMKLSKDFVRHTKPKPIEDNDAK